MGDEMTGFRGVSRTRRLALLLLLCASMVISLPVHISRAQNQVTTRALYQGYQNGFMIYRADTGEILVFFNRRGLVSRYAQSVHEALPINPVTDPNPPGLRPQGAFGRVWGNFAEVRSEIGWAVTREQGYQAVFTPAPPTDTGLQQTVVNLRNGRRVSIREDSSWRWADRPNTPANLPPLSTFRATFQPFEHGYMLWWSETGSIWVLPQGGPAQLYDPARTSRLADNPVGEEPPPGLLKPTLGLGKVWGNFPKVRQALGWATAAEQGYVMSFERADYPQIRLSRRYAFIVSFPDGTSTVISDLGYWWNTEHQTGFTR
jgi:hypothetical protein